jgi:hypothetical protein
MTAPSGGGQPFDLGRYAAPPPLVIATEVLDVPMAIDQRQSIWRRVGVLPALTVVAGLFADLDLAAITDTRSDVERAFIDSAVGELQSRLVAQLNRGRAIFSNVGLVQCIKEIVEFTDEHSEQELSVLDLTRCVLGVNQDNDQVDASMMARAANPDDRDIATLRADFLELALDFIAQGLFDQIDTFETLACSVDETWRRGWAPGTEQKVIHDFGAGPADVFAEVVGVDLDDFLTLAWFFWNAARNDGQVGFDSGLLAATGLGPKEMERTLGETLPRIRRFLRQSGGIPPVPRRRRADHLSLVEREEISRGIAAGLSPRSIAERIDRPSSTVSREIGRNGGRDAYRALAADAAAFDRARRPKVSKLAANAELAGVVAAKLDDDWSPQQIAQWLRREHPNEVASIPMKC